jgi:hypothetical protein
MFVRILQILEEVVMVKQELLVTLQILQYEGKGKEVEFF